MKWLGYTRVSRVGDRAETLISPELQAERIRSYATAHGLAVEILEPELDISGAKLDRPILDAALRRIEADEAQGVIVAQLDRLSRAGILDTHRLISLVEEMGGRVIAVAENFDDATPEGRMGRNVMLALGEMQLDRYRAQFADAKAQAVRRGIWPISKVPRGYLKGRDRHLVAAPDASVVVSAFEARAEGAPWSAVAEILGCGLSGAAKIISNRVYLGEINLGDLRNPDAHEPLVERSLWEAAQLSHPKPPRGIHGPALLAGIIRCEACGFLMTPDGYRGWRGYRCRPRKVKGICDAPAIISASVVDPLVEATVLAAVSDAAYSFDAPDEIADAEALLDAAEAELAAYQEAERVSGVGAEHFAAGMRSRVAAVNDARRNVAEARLAAAPLAEAGNVVELWPSLTVLERRHVLRGSLSAVWVRRGPGGAERVRVEDRGGATLPAPEDFGEDSSEV